MTKSLLATIALLALGGATAAGIPFPTQVEGLPSEAPKHGGFFAAAVKFFNAFRKKEDTLTHNGAGLNPALATLFPCAPQARRARRTKYVAKSAALLSRCGGCACVCMCVCVRVRVCARARATFAGTA